MSYCLNPFCSRRQNPQSAKFCSTCGFKLLLGDRYRTIKPIGRGGFGRTFLAVDEYKPSQPACVIKQFWPQNQNIHDAERARELFRREAIQLEQLGRHAQIPELLAHFEQAGYQYLVQEFIDGRNLLEEVEQMGAFNDLQVWQLLNDLLPVLEFIHHHQVIHRDIKPHNIIRRSSTQQYVLVDFGAAKSIQGSDLARTGTSIGSPEFVAPEQAIGKATYASDLYSLGVTCIYLLTRIRPAEMFDTEEGCWVWRHHLHCPINSILADILDKLLQGPLRKRYQSASEVLEDLYAPEILMALGLTEKSISKVEPVQPVPVHPVRTPAIPVPEASPAIADSADLQSTVLPPVETMPLWVCTHTLTGHLSWVRSVVIHPDGQRLASGSGDRTLKIWNLETGELLQTIAAHTGWLREIAGSPDGRLLASGSNDRTVKLWQWETGEPVHCLKGHGDWVRSVAFSPDGQWLASSSQDKTIRLWRVETGELLKTLAGHDHWVTSVAFLPPVDQEGANQWLLASGSRDKTIRIWNGRTGKVLAVLEGHTDAVNEITVSPSAQLLASGSDDGTIRLWDLKTRRLVRTLRGHEGAVNSIAFSPEGALLASGSQDRTIKLWSVETGTLMQTLTGHTNWVWSVTFSPDGKTIASGGWDAAIKIWRKDL